MVTGRKGGQQVGKWRQKLVVLLVLATLGVAFITLRRTPSAAPPHPDPAAGVTVTIDVSERQLHVLEAGQMVASYPVAVGSPKHPTPRGSFTVRRIIWNPRWVPPEAEWASDEQPREPGDPDNPMGRVKIFFKEPDYYVHGTDAEVSIGRAASHGCVRMRNADIIELARTLMDHGSAPVEPGLIRRLVNRIKQTKEVRLERPVTLRVRT
jgi:murein L,D-transpeptidase YcbB/YkuD